MLFNAGLFLVFCTFGICWVFGFAITAPLLVCETKN